MANNDTELLNEQRERRKRINRLKTGIVMTIAIWMLGSFLAIIILSVQVYKLNKQVANITGGNVQTQTTDTEAQSLGNTQLDEESYANVVTGIDTEDNFAVEGDVHNVYLTFNSVPGENTNAILDVLAAYGVKATFFVSGSEEEGAEAVYQRIVNEGHTIAVHTASHQYTEIYSSVEAYLTDFEKMSSHIESVTGVKPEIFRFPGGSVNTYNSSLYREIIAEMTRRGYTYYDWNVSSGDAAIGVVTKERIISNVLTGSAAQDDAIVLMHDGPGHSATAAALPQIIEGLKEQGYTFDRLDKTVTPWCFGY